MSGISFGFACRGFMSGGSFNGGWLVWECVGGSLEGGGSLRQKVSSGEGATEHVWCFCLSCNGIFC